MRKALYCAVALGAAIAGATAAAAGADHGRYRIVPYPVGHHSGKVVILDQQTGTLWTWSEADGMSYVPGILRPGTPGAFARIIRVSP